MKNLILGSKLIRKFFNYLADRIFCSLFQKLSLLIFQTLHFLYQKPLLGKEIYLHFHKFRLGMDKKELHLIC